MSALYVILALVACQRLAELVHARRNTRRLLARGGVEVGAGHYPLMVALHAGWLLAMALLIAPKTPLSVPLLTLYGLLQLARLWVQATLGRYWTTRIVIVADAPLIQGGPYRFLRHPNYAVVVAEVAVLPLVFGAWEIAALFSALNLVLLRHRIHIEEAALAPRRAPARP
ncbi:MAG: isoprenylcysteine carboxylmethyltransferase family protein [Alphaproteobacteria bacterium]|nr:isoprenylcysteine carboxylmethyltransferase family protein [Alphaproteobacteria bacterium]